jgi:enoyl-CoA hydratase/carnithine racemase
LIFSAEFVDAAEGYRIGLFNRVVPKERLMDETLAARPHPMALSLSGGYDSRLLASLLAPRLPFDPARWAGIFAQEDHP